MNANQLKAAILKAQDLKREAITVPEWGIVEGLYIQELNALQTVQFMDKMSRAFDAEGKPKQADPYLASWLVAKSLCDRDGSLLFAEVQDVEALATKNNTVLEGIVAKCMKLNGLTADAEEEKKS